MAAKRLYMGDFFERDLYRIEKGGRYHGYEKGSYISDERTDKTNRYYCE